MELAVFGTGSACTEGELPIKASSFSGTICDCSHNSTLFWGSIQSMLSEVSIDSINIKENRPVLDDATIVQLSISAQRSGWAADRAAEALSVTQPTLSTAIARLERQYRIQLLARIPRKGVEPTLAGSRLLSALEPLLDSVGRPGSIARGTDDPLQGELSVGIHAPLAPFYSPTIVLEAARLSPGSI